jgi:riboflavin transporter 2
MVNKRFLKSPKQVKTKEITKPTVLGLWCETVIMVHELPEKWKLSSILSASTQIAQIGPIFFLIGKHFRPNAFTYTRAIYVVLSIGATSCFLLAFFWNTTAFIWGKEYSIGLYILNFSLAILDGTSSVTFLPYIGGNYNKEYMIPK